MAREVTVSESDSNTLPRHSIQSRVNWKSISKVVMFIIIVFEAFRILQLRCLTINNRFTATLGFAGSILLLIIYFMINLCYDTAKGLRYQILKEAIFLSSAITFLYIIQRDYLIVIPPNDSSFLARRSQSITVFGIFSVFLIIQSILKMSALSKIILSIYYYLYIVLRYFTVDDKFDYKVYMNILCPGGYIILLFIIQIGLRKYEVHPTAPPKSSLYRYSNTTEEVKAVLQVIDESIIALDKKGDFNVLNTISLKKLDYSDGEDFLSKVKDLTLISERGIDPSDDFKDLLDTGKEGKLGSSIALKRQASKNLVKGFTVDPMSNLCLFIKSIFNSITNKKLKEAKVLEYQGVIERERKNNIDVRTKIYILPGYCYPVIVSVQENSSKKELVDMKAFESTRENLMIITCGQINRIIELARVALHNTTRTILTLSLPVKDQLKTTETSSMPIAHSLNVLSRLVEDYFNFCYLKRPEIKFKYAKCNVKEIVEGVIYLYHHLAKAKNIKLNFNCQEFDNYSIISDQDRLIQVVSELLNNAIKHAENSEIMIALNGYNGTFKIVVEDAGVGISKDKLTEIETELKEMDPNYKKLFAKKCNNRGLLYANALAYELGPKSLSGLTIKSEIGIKTSVLVLH